VTTTRKTYIPRTEDSMPQVKRQRVLEGKSVVEVNKNQNGEGRAGIKKEEQDDQEDDDEGMDNSGVNNDGEL
jgi:hypothetical protein